MSDVAVSKELEEAQAEEARATARAQDALAKLRAMEARKAEAEAIREEHTAEMVAISRRDAEREEREYAARDYRNHVYQFDSSFNPTTVKACISILTAWSRMEPGCDLTLVFNSPGGSVIDGFALWDFLASLKRNGHHLTTICRGMAASMAGILLQAGDVRIIGSESVLLVHEISFGAGGKIGEVEDEVAFAKMLTQRVLRIFAKKTHLSEAQIDRRWKRKDWWLDSDEALKLGFADEIA